MIYLYIFFILTLELVSVPPYIVFDNVEVANVFVSSLHVCMIFSGAVGDCTSLKADG